jgi:hypothetical protein
MFNTVVVETIALSLSIIIIRAVAFLFLEYLKEKNRKLGNTMDNKPGHEHNQEGQ